MKHTFYKKAVLVIFVFVLSAGFVLPQDIAQQANAMIMIDSYIRDLSISDTAISYNQERDGYVCIKAYPYILDYIDPEYPNDPPYDFVDYSRQTDIYSGSMETTGLKNVFWQGRDQNGNVVGPGLYMFEVLIHAGPGCGWPWISQIWEQKEFEIISPPLPQSWSFAIISDLHIGRGYPDYDGASYEGAGEGEDYYLTKRLEKVVDWINENKDKIDCDGIKCPIQFLAVLGDIADTAEKSEFLKAKEILDKLNDAGIPYVPIFGNHDVWPYTDFEEAPTSSGESYFDEIFWDENATNTKLVKERFSNSFKRDEVHKNYKNFVFNYKDINFIGLDFIKREKTAKAEISTETENWLRDRLNEYQGEEPVIIFSHHPFAKPFSRLPYVQPWWNFESEEIERIKGIIGEYENIAEGNQILGSFAGHIHGYYPQEILGFNLPLISQFFNANWEYPKIEDISVLTTESLIVGGNEKDITNKGVIRIVKVNEKKEIDFSKIEGKFPALNPYISFDFKILPEQIYPCVFFKAHLFTHRDHSLIWNLGDGNIGTGIIETHCYKRGGTYDVKLTGIDKETGEEEYITRKITVKEGIIPKIIKIAEEVKDKLELISTELEEKVTEFGRTMKDTILIKVKHSPSTPAGLINVHFEKATGDIDLTEMIVDTDPEAKKSILYMSQWPEEIEQEKVLFIPK